MTGGLAVTGASVDQLALRLVTVRGTAAYAAYLVDAGGANDAIAELADELRALDAALAVACLAPRTGEQLVTELARTASELVLVDGTALGAAEWAVLDRRRSAISHPGVLVFVTTPDGFGQLMQAAPNLASWLGGLVFERVHDVAQLAHVREQRLAALRSWAHRSDQEVVHAASHGQLPADPEYAEWLVLLGRGDLLERA